MRPTFWRISHSVLLVVLSGCEGVVGDLGMPVVPPVVVAGKPTITAFSCTPDSGPAPLASVCSLSVSHPDGKPLKCTLTVSDGRTALMDSAECAGSLTQAMTFDRAGSFVVTLVVRDALGASVEQVRTIAVAERPNLVPVIASFVANPAAGTVPLNTTFTWAVSDPEGEALSCSIDVGNDGSVEYPTLDCATASRTHTLATAGAVEVLFVVKDARGLAAKSVITLTARAPVGDVRISKIEWAQSIVLENLRLVQGKAALLRVHVLGDKAGLLNLVVDAEGFTAAGVSLGKLTLVGPSTPPVAVVPADLRQQWTATVPAAWVEVGFEIRLKLDPLDVIAETDETNNGSVLKPAVGKGNVVLLTSVPVIHQGTTGAVVDIQPIVTSMWPVKALVNATRAPYTFGGVLQSGSTTAWGQLLQAIAGVRQADGSSRYYYGWAKVNYGSGIAGIGYVGDEAATGRDDSDDTAAHELGHNFGRNHAPCGGVAGADANFPHAGGKIGTWGYNAITKTLLNPATYVDLMSYCNPVWISDYTYRAVQTRLETQAFVAPGGPAMYVPVVLVAGVIRNGTEVTLRPVHQMVAARSANQDGAWAVRLVTRDGQQVVVPFTPVEVADSEDGEHHFTFTVPDPGSLVAVEVLNGSTVLQRTLSQATDVPTPVLKAVGSNAVQLSWDARQFGSAQIAHLATDGTRTTLALWLTDGAALVRTDGLVGGRFEVSLSDGVRSTRSVVELHR